MSNFFLNRLRVIGGFVPITLIFFTFLDVFININYPLICNILGYSLATNFVFMLYYTFNKRYCYITRIAPIGLILVNLVDIVGCFINYEIYKFIFTFVISSLAIGLGIYYDINKRMNR